jgi:hypothetical protein
MHTCMHAYQHACMHIWTFATAMLIGTYLHVHTCMHMYIYTYIQDYVMAFMMGTHSRLGADSPVLLLDPLVAASIAQIIIADKW